MNRLSKQKGSAHVAVIVVLVAALLFALGWIFWQNFILKQPKTSNQKPLIITKNNQPDKKPTPAMNMLTISQLGVSYDLPSSIKDVAYTIDSSKSLFPGDVAVVSAITGSNGKTFPKATSANVGMDDQDAICESLGIGVSNQPNLADVTTGQSYESAGSKDGKYFYKVTGGGANCGMSTDAQAVATDVKNALKNPM